MLKVLYNDLLVYKVVIWAFWGISLWKEKLVLRSQTFVNCKNRK